jgi:hypothetical protein
MLRGRLLARVEPFPLLGLAPVEEGIVSQYWLMALSEGPAQVSCLAPAAGAPLTIASNTAAATATVRPLNGMRDDGSG